MKARFYCGIAVLFFLSSGTFAGWQKAAHLTTLPIIEAGGIYTSVVALQETNSNSTRAPAITTLSLLGLNAAAGLTTMLGPQENYPVMRVIHRSIGFAVTAAAIWLSVAETADDRVKNTSRNVCYAYTGLTMSPLLIFNF
jgi:heme A synthase